MVYTFVFFTIFVLIVIYSITTHNNQFAATASAIRQVWSGRCRLSCRQSECSQDTQGPSQAPCCQSVKDCICESCPCELIDNFLKTVRPATRAYTNLADVFSHYFYILLTFIANSYDYVSRVLQCRAGCQRQAQILSTKQYESSENFSFTNSVGDAKAQKRSSISFKEPVVSEANGEDSPTQSVKAGIGISEEIISATEERGYCSKCIEEGKICVPDCPKAKK